MESKTPLVAVVEDDEAVCRALCRLLRTLHYEPIAFGSVDAFLDSLPARVPRCAIVDLHLLGRKGIEILAHPCVQDGRLPVIMVTGFDQVGMRERCLDAGAVAYMTKPIAASILSAALHDIVGPG